MPDDKERLARQQRYVARRTPEEKLAYQHGFLAATDCLLERVEAAMDRCEAAPQSFRLLVLLDGIKDLNDSVRATLRAVLSA